MQTLIAPRPNRVVGFSGLAGSGKDYLWDWLRMHSRNEHVERVALADEVRYELQDVFAKGNYLPRLWDKPYPEPVRWILQHYGTEYRRAQDPDYWVDLAQEVIEDIFRETPGALVCVTDVRYQNEVDMIHRLGGHVLEVRCDPLTRAFRLGNIVLDDHASETIDFTPDGFIINDESPNIDPAWYDFLGLA